MTLLAIWLAALAGMGVARRQTMTAEKTMTWLRTRSLDGLSAADRRSVIDGLARRVNRLSFEQRQQFRFEKELRAFYESMTEAERASYIDLTLPRGLHQAMQAFNKMPADKRKQLVQRALNDLQRAQSEVGRAELGRALSDENMKRVIDQGLQTYWLEASASAKIDIQPLLEQVQALLQGAR